MILLWALTLTSTLDDPTTKELLRAAADTLALLAALGMISPADARGA